jgi:para-nitrobenzyl esterase
VSFDVCQTEESEDCLYLNIWTRSSEVNDKHPVMVWTHGGGNLGGAGSEDAFDGTQLASTGVSLVTFNYCLGACGFLAHPKLGANFGILDDITALLWVQANITIFGVDPTNVTIFGQSAGSHIIVMPPGEGVVSLSHPSKWRLRATGICSVMVFRHPSA